MRGKEYDAMMVKLSAYDKCKAERDEAIALLSELYNALPNGESGNDTWEVMDRCEPFLRKHNRLPAAGGAE